VRFAEVESAVRGVPIITPEQGRRLYDHVREQRPEAVLEIGTWAGASAAYMAAALEANGAGKLTTVDRGETSRYLKPEETIERAGLSHRVELVKVRDSSYDWHLAQLVRERSDAEGNCEPLYDFCYLDGAHNLAIDAAAVVFIEKLLRPGGWLLLDDLDWTYEEGSDESVQSDGVTHPLSEEERAVPHVRLVYDLIVRQHPAFSRFHDDGSWGWAQKLEAAPRRYRVETSESITSAVLRNLRDLKRRR